jgi:hypothetical protein
VEILNGCFILPGALPIWRMFHRLSRGRGYAFSGNPLPLTYRDIRDAAERCKCELSSDVVEDIFATLDDLLLELCSRDDDQHNRRNQQPAGATGRA